MHFHDVCAHTHKHVQFIQSTANVQLRNTNSEGTAAFVIADELEFALIKFDLSCYRACATCVMKS